MIKLNLLIADTDHAYIERLTTYLNHNDLQRFNVSWVSSEESLEKYVTNRGGHIDIALVHPKFSKTLANMSSATIILLSDGRLNILDKGKPVINKFMRGDLIVSYLIEKYTLEHPEHMYLNHSSSRIKTIAVFSPLGGVGKSVISAASSIIAKQSGKEVFYLNLEDGCSTNCFFDGAGFMSISELMYYLKEKKEQIQMKIEAISFKDPSTGVRCFAPPESLTDIAELDESETEELILSMMKSKHDLLFIDLSNQLSQKNMKVLELADEILLIGSHGNTSVERMNQFLRHISVMEKRKGMTFIEKTHYIENQYALMSGKKEDDESTLYSFKTRRIIPYDKELQESHSRNLYLGSSFGKSIHGLTKTIIGG